MLGLELGALSLPAVKMAAIAFRLDLQQLVAP